MTPSIAMPGLAVSVRARKSQVDLRGPERGLAVSNRQRKPNPTPSLDSSSVDSLERPETGRKFARI